MRRLQTIMLGLALVGAAVDARADALVTGGEIRVRGWSLNDYHPDGSSTEYWDQRLRLNATWPVAVNVRVQVRVDILEGTWGDESLVAPQAAGVDPSAAAPTVTTALPTVPSKREIEVNWANLQFVLPGTPLRFSLGRQDVSWGTGFWVQADDRDRFEVAAKLDPVVVVFAYDKFVQVLEGGGTRDDQRGWAIGAVTDAAGFKVGLLVAYLKDGSRTRFPAGDVRYVAGDLFTKGRLGPLKLAAELNYGGGTIDRDALGDVDASGLGGYAGLFLPVGPTVTLGLEGAYVQGDDPTTPAKQEGFFSADYHGPYTSLIFYNAMDYSGYARDNQSSSYEMDFSVRNARTGKLSAVFTPTENLSISAAGLYAAADRTKPGVDRELGWEFDLFLTYRITGNVSFTAGVGYALLGDYWKSAPIAAGAGRLPDNPLACVAAFTTTF